MDNELKPKISKEKLIALIVIPVVLLIAAALIIINFVHIYETFEVKPGCESDGGVYKKCVICGSSEELSRTAPVGHKPATKITQESTAASMGKMETRCTVCKTLIALERTPAKYSPIPSVRLIGSGAGMTNIKSISATFTYTDGSEALEADVSKVGGNVKVRLMNGGERTDAKHSYVLQDFEVADGEYLSFGDFGSSNEIDMYASNDDPTFSRRTVTYKQWKNIVSENYPEYDKYITASDDTEYAGYSTLLYIKSTKPDYSFAGIYTLTIPYENFAANNTDAAIKYVVRQTGSNEDGAILKYIYGNSSEEDAAVASLKGLLESDIDKISEKTDVDLLVDYFTFSIMTGNVDAFSDIYWVTSDGVHWYPVPTGTEHSYGTAHHTVALNPTDVMLSDFGVFWDSFFEFYYVSVKDRYNDLKATRLTVANVEEEFERSISKLDLEIYEADSQTYENTFYNPYDEAEKLSLWYTERLKVLDELFSK